MHIEPGIVDGARIALSYVTAAAAGGYALALATKDVRDRGLLSVTIRSGLAAVAVFTFFEILPHARIGVSELHLILGSTLFLILGAAPAAAGLAIGLLLQGLIFEPADLPQYGMNLTTLLVPLFALRALADRVIPPRTAYVDLAYGQVAALSAAFQAGVVAWVAFWVLYGQGFTAATLTSIGTFAASYILVVAIEPLVDLGVLAAAKTLRGLEGASWLTPRLYRAA